MRTLLTPLVVVIVLLASLAFRDVPLFRFAQDPPKLNLPDGFQADFLYSPTEADSSSWVSLAVDGKGRLLASDQYGSLYRIEPAPIGSDPATTKVQKLDVALGHAQGLLWAFNSLYVVVNSEEGIDGNGSGLYRLLDTDGDDEFDTIRTLSRFEGWGEHGPHSILLGPDGASLYLVAGNHTELPDFKGSLVPRVWQEDQVLPVIRDPRGHAADRKAPGGWIARTDSLGTDWELVSAGFRNTFDIGFDRSGELFAWDSDMEWDLGMPWYRPIRLLHATSGSDFGWRTGSGKWPAYYPDTLPPVVEVGQGSPTAVVGGANLAFPTRFREGMFLFDWSFGTIYWTKLTAAGGSYAGEVEEFLSGVPLPLTDGVVGPDGALYFVTGGRNLDSFVIRVAYVGDEDTSAPRPAPISDEQVLRRSLEAFHGHEDPAAVEAAWPHLDHPDRHVRFAARVAIEHQPVASWQERALLESDAVRRVHALVALARHADPSVRDRAYASLLEVDPADLSMAEYLDLLRAYGLVMIRLGAPPATMQDAVIAAVGAGYPGTEEALNREQGRLLAVLGAPGIVDQGLALLAAYGEDAPAHPLLLADSVLFRSKQYGPKISEMLANMPHPQAIDVVMSLRGIEAGWTLEQRRTYFQWFYDALRRSGGESYVGFIEHIRADALERLSQADREALGDLADAFGVQALDFANLPRPEGPGRNWNPQEIYELMDTEMAGPRSLEVGERMYDAALCRACHVMGGRGGLVGPDLSQVGTRIGRWALVRTITSPSETISDQFAATLLTMHDGRTVSGMLVQESDEAVELSLNAFAPGQNNLSVPKADIATQEFSPISVMPARLIDRLNGQEVMDLLAFLLSGGDPSHPCYTHEQGCDGE
ncbi:MAG: heme-binding protein [Bacteroidetes bacterium]|nr:heme-binding protein [Bacteroidota bacterium]